MDDLGGKPTIFGNTHKTGIFTYPKNPWTLQWRGERTCIAGVWVLKIAFFEGSGFLGYMNRGVLDKLVGKHTIH